MKPAKKYTRDELMGKLGMQNEAIEKPMNEEEQLQSIINKNRDIMMGGDSGIVLHTDDDGPEDDEIN
jgi:hypothetical protein